MLSNNAAYNVRFKSWKKSHPPKKILVIRYQALGDTIATLPYLQNIKRHYQGIELHLIVRKEFSDVHKYIDLFDSVVTIGGSRNAKSQFIFTLLKVPYLWKQRYDVVIDLQNNRISNILRKLLKPDAWSEYDRYSAIAGSERFRLAIEALGLWKVGLDTNFRINIDAEKLLLKNGWEKNNSLVVLNPAGAFPSRNWPVEYYIEFARQWLIEINPDTQFVLLLLPSLTEKANFMAEALGDRCINLTGMANQIEAFAVIQKSTFVLSEDGALMHMAWVQGIPTLALFSSSKKVWSAPQGDWSLCLDSSDLECGPCDFFICKYGDNRCLTRYSPEFVLAKATQLLAVKKMSSHA